MEVGAKDGSFAPTPAPPEGGHGHEFLGIKLKRGILGRKRVGGPCTPVPTWRLEELRGGVHDSGHKGGEVGPPCAAAAAASRVGPSARKLAASLWEFERRVPARMSRAVRGRQHREKALLVDDDLASHCPPDQPQSAGSLRRHVAASLMQHHRVMEKNARALQSVSPATYSSSMEIAAYNPPLTPTSSLDFRGRLDETGYNIKTSTELLKVLNRIWSLEEQHASNTALVRALKMELGHARSRIQELMQKQRSDHQEIDDLMKQLMEDKLVKKTKQQEKIKAAVQSVRDELEDEKKLRRRSESLHRKLAKELFEVKAAFSKALKELEKERKSRILLEELCDEFAKGMGIYEQEIRSMRHKYEKEHGGQDDDKLILHISEAWLDEREQMKHAEALSNREEKDTAVDRLKREIETFLKVKRGIAFVNDIPHAKDSKRGSSLHRYSLESVHLNGAVSAPQDAGDDDSMASNFHYLELNKICEAKEVNGHDRSNGEIEKGGEDLEELAKSKMVGSREKMKSRSSLQVQVEEEIEGPKSCDPDTIANTGERTTSETVEAGEGKKNKRDRMLGWTHEINDLAGPNVSSSCEVKAHPENDRKDGAGSHLSKRGNPVTVSGDGFTGTSFGLPSPVQQWNLRHTSPDIIERSECSTKGARGMRENTLKAKLLEARLEGQNARLRGSRVK